MLHTAMSVSLRSMSIHTRICGLTLERERVVIIFSLAGEMSGHSDFLRQADYIAEKMRLPVATTYKPMPFKEEPSFLQRGDLQAATSGIAEIPCRPWNTEGDCPTLLCAG